MYFAKNEFTPDEEVAVLAKQDALEAIRIGREYHGIHLDGTSASISALDEILDRIHQMVSTAEDPKEPASRFARLFGSYFGEILREEHGAVWGIERIYSDTMPAQQIGPNEIVIIPWNRANERILGGAEKSLRTYYDTLIRSLQAGEALDVNGVNPVRKDRLYPIQHHEDYLEVGICADGRQLLKGFFHDGLTAIFFDSAGYLLGCEVRPFPEEARKNTAESDAAIGRAWEVWMEEIGYQPETIHVRKFVVPELGIGIEDRPGYMEDFLKAPELDEPDEEERKWMFDLIHEWDEDGSFVLYYGNDLFMDGEGDISST